MSRGDGRDEPGLSRSNPDLLAVVTDKGLPEEEKGQRRLQAPSDNAGEAKKMLKLFVSMGLRGK